MDEISLKDVWRYVDKDSGRLFVMMSGAIKRQKLYVGNLDSLET